jgi:ADP-ribose pyrophosphatase YjhB (NUDIX family)
LTNRKKILSLESVIDDPSDSLPEDVFLFITRLTPMINVDLLIKNDCNQTLLTWRDDGDNYSGWHIPGGIIRYKETIFDRIGAVASSELGASVAFKKNILAVNEVIIQELKNRGHFISLLYECTLKSPLDAKLKYNFGKARPGEWAWHDSCPDDLLSVQNFYRKYLC